MIATDVWEKSASEKRWFAFDFEDLLETGEALSGSPTLTVPSPLVEEDNATVGTQVQVQVSGGVLRGRYLVRCVISTTAGETLELAGYLKITTA